MEMKQGKILQENVQLAVKAKQLIVKKKSSKIPVDSRKAQQ